MLSATMFESVMVLGSDLGNRYRDLDPICLCAVVLMGDLQYVKGLRSLKTK